MAGLGLLARQPSSNSAMSYVARDLPAAIRTRNSDRRQSSADGQRREYALALEHPFLAALEDCIAGVRWAASEESAAVARPTNCTATAEPACKPARVYIVHMATETMNA